MFIARTEKELKCPSCGGQLTIEDIMDNDFDDKIFSEWGWCQCEKCHATFSIEVVYNFAHYKVGKRM